MGLDMYLTASRYTSSFSFSSDEEKAHVKSVTDIVGIVPTARHPAINISVYVGYWRKANAIHRWFVTNVQDGDDDCGSYYVSREDLSSLKDICERILSLKNSGASVLDVVGLALDILPPQSGFFFGNAEVNDWYFEDLQYTYDLLSELLFDPKYEPFDFEYRSSW